METSVYKTPTEIRCPKENDMYFNEGRPSLYFPLKAGPMFQNRNLFKKVRSKSLNKTLMFISLLLHIKNCSCNEDELALLFLTVEPHSAEGCPLILEQTEWRFHPASDCTKIFIILLLNLSELSRN